MKKKSRKSKGFSLVEVIISLALIAILSIGVYNAYLILIRQTKDGEAKQEATLAGKKIVEEIKATTKEIEHVPDSKDIKIKMGDSAVTLKKNSDDSENPSEYKTSTLTVDGYDYIISIDPKKTESNNEISISKDNYGEHKYILVDNTMITNNILKLSISSNGDINKPDSFKDSYNIDNKSIVLDFKNYSDSDDITVEVTNEFNKTLKLYILNSKYNESKERNVTVENARGALNEYYRYDYEGKSGTLYDVTVTVSGKNSRGQEVAKLFESSFVQNIETN